MDILCEWSLVGQRIAEGDAEVLGDVPAARRLVLLQDFGEDHTNEIKDANRDVKNILVIADYINEIFDISKDLSRTRTSFRSGPCWTRREVAVACNCQFLQAA